MAKSSHLQHPAGYYPTSATGSPLHLQEAPALPSVRSCCARYFPWWRLSYLLDWAVLLLVCLTELAVAEYAFSPFKRYDPIDPAFSYPFTKNETFPNWLMGIIIVSPIFIFAVFQAFMRSTHDFHNACLGLAEAVGFSLIFTSFTKVAAGRYRPDWYSREGMDAAAIADGRQSFPSGHSSLSFAAMTFLSLYLSGKVGLFRNNGGAVWKAFLVISPLVLSSAIAISRTRDNRHHFSDILAGSVLGTLFAVFAYMLNYYSLTSEASHLPKLRDVSQPIVYLNHNYPSALVQDDVYFIDVEKGQGREASSTSLDNF